MIREFEEKDIEQVMRIWYNTNIQAHFFIDMSYWDRKRDQVREMIRDAEVYVCEVNGQIEGFMGLQGDYVAGMFVKPEMQNRGIGKDLMDHVKKKKKKLELDVYQKNWTGVRFYVSQEFSEEDITKNQETGENQIRMVWEKRR